MLGLDRDSQLWLRGTPDRLLARSFALSNWDVLKSIYNGSFVSLRAGPFADVAYNSRWLADAGLQVKVTLLGSLSANLSYGRNLRTGDGAWFVNTSR
ncbi:hypothetical protein D3C83_65890 [compost metagenome]